MNNRGKGVLAVVILFFMLACLTVVLRVYTRRVLLKTWGRDDSAMVITLFLFAIYSILQGTAAVYGSGQHRWDIPDADARIALMCTYLCELFYVLTNCTLKVALAIFYLRFAVDRWHIFVIQNLMGGTVLFGVTYFFLAMFQCIPVSEFWNNHPASSKCLSPEATTGITFALGATNAFADWTFSLLPIFIIRTIQMKTKTKILVVGILAFASIGSTATLVRMKYVRSLENGPDWLFATYEFAIWSTVEPGIGIAAGSIATLRPLFQKALWRLGLASAPSSEARAGAVNQDDRRQTKSPDYRRDFDLRTLVPPSQGVTSTTISGPLTPNSWGNWSQSPSVPLKEYSVTERGIQQPAAMGQVSEGPPRLHLRDSLLGSFTRDNILSQKETDHPTV